MDSNPDPIPDFELLQQSRREKGELSPRAFSEIQGELCDICRTAIECYPANRDDENISMLLNPRPGSGSRQIDGLEYALRHHSTMESLDRSVSQNCFICVTLWREVEEHDLEGKPIFAERSTWMKSTFFPGSENAQNFHLVASYDTDDVSHYASVAFSFANAIGGSFSYRLFHISF